MGIAPLFGANCALTLLVWEASHGFSLHTVSYNDARMGHSKTPCVHVCTMCATYWQRYGTPMVRNDASDSFLSSTIDFMLRNPHFIMPFLGKNAWCTRSNGQVIQCCKYSLLGWFLGASSFGMQVHMIDYNPHCLVNMVAVHRRLFFSAHLTCLLATISAQVILHYWFIHESRVVTTGFIPMDTDHAHWYFDRHAVFMDIPFCCPSNFLYRLFIVII